MEIHEESQRFFRVAQRDLHALRNMLDEQDFQEATFGFHAQQCAEKALKAWIAKYGVTPPRVHDIRQLLTILETLNCDVAPWLTLYTLTPFAGEFRYDDELSHGTPLARADLARQLENLLDVVARASVETRQETDED